MFEERVYCGVTALHISHKYCSTFTDDVELRIIDSFVLRKAVVKSITLSKMCMTTMLFITDLFLSNISAYCDLNNLCLSGFYFRIVLVRTANL